ncbi:Protein EMBRYONIC FLOWER 1 [Quillaja saponaria]|uniref:Protein EMBRYONIC FLOWER 1 n=1 Tax=Quillaja saponaria TaxID=32244 RepID=A0AAD7LIN1_QUISA|nr:Protein EMBRYONIC FLOWER 1 [Quillaja saponaria]
MIVTVYLDLVDLVVCSMETGVAVKGNHHTGGSSTVVKSSGSFIQIDSISIDLANPNGKIHADKCEHFSIRGYVSEMRKKDWRRCCPFQLEDNQGSSDKEQTSLLPDLAVPKFKWWNCQNCLQDIAAEGNVEDNGIVFKFRGSDCKSQSTVCHGSPLRDAAVLQTGNEIGLEVNSSHQMLGSPNVLPGCGSDEAAVVELGARKLNSVAKSSAEICNTKSIPSADDQHHTKLAKPCLLSGVGSINAMADNEVKDHTSGHPPPESSDWDRTVLDSANNLARNGCQDHHLYKSTGSRRRPRKLRRLTEILGETKTDNLKIQEFPCNRSSIVSASTHSLSIPQGKVDNQDTMKTLGPNRKRKLLQDGLIPAEIHSRREENTEVLNLERDGETIDHSVLGGNKNEVDRSLTMGGNKKIPVVNTPLSLELAQERARKEHQENTGGSTKIFQSDRLSLGFLTSAFMGKGRDPCPGHSLRTETKSNMSKGKDKMPQVNELPYNSWKDGMLISGPIAQKDEENFKKFLIAFQCKSAEDDLNEKGLEKGLHPSLDSFLAAESYHRKSSHQFENQLPLALPWNEDTLKLDQVMRKCRENNIVGESSVPSKYQQGVIPGKVHCEPSSKTTTFRSPLLNEKRNYISQVKNGDQFHKQQMEISGRRSKKRTIEAQEHPVINKKNGERTVEKESELGVVDDTLIVAELMAKFQHERALVSAENENRLLEKTKTRKKQNFQGITNGMIAEEYVGPDKRKSVPQISAFDGSLNLTSLGQSHALSMIREVPQSQKKPSGGFQYSAVGSSRLNSTQCMKRNGGIMGSDTSLASSQESGGCHCSKSIFPGNIFKSKTPNHMPVGYDSPEKVASQSAQIGKLSQCSGSLLKPNSKRNIDLKFSNVNGSNIEKLNRSLGPETFSRKSTEHPYPHRHGGIDLHQNVRRPLDLYPSDTIPAMHLLSLMDPGMRSGTSFNVGVSTQLLKGLPNPQDYGSKLDIQETRAGSSKQKLSDHYGKNNLSEKARGCFLGTPMFGASTSSIQHDKSFVNEKRKSSHSPVPNRGSKPQEPLPTGVDLGKNDGAGPVFGTQTKLPGVPSTFKLFGWPYPGNEPSVQCNSEARGTSATLLPPRKGSKSDICGVNKNPADFTMPEPGNVYMIKGEDLKFGNTILSKNRPGLIGLRRSKELMNLKRANKKERAKR